MLLFVLVDYKLPTIPRHREQLPSSTDRTYQRRDTHFTSRLLPVWRGGGGGRRGCGQRHFHPQHWVGAAAGPRLGWQLAGQLGSPRGTHPSTGLPDLGHNRNDNSVVIAGTTVFMVLSSWHCHCESLLASFDEDSTSYGTKPVGFCYRSTKTDSCIAVFIIAIYYSLLRATTCNAIAHISCHSSVCLSVRPSQPNTDSSLGEIRNFRFSMYDSIGL